MDTSLCGQSYAGRQRESQLQADCPGMEQPAAVDLQHHMVRLRL